MFESISDKLTTVFRTIAGKAKITEDNIQEAMREVRVALLEADVNLQVARDFIAGVKEEALGEKVLNAVNPGEQFIKIVHDRLVELLGGEREEIKWAAQGPTVIMLCGLQGAGKTTTVAKLASRFKNQNRRKPLLVAADVQRPAAIEQLKILGQQIGVPVYAELGGDPVQICAQALEVARMQGADTILLDTAGRLHVDDALMFELENIVARTKPQEILFVCDAMIGQSAVDTAAEFRKRLPLTGAIMTKMDSDARGGSALSLREVTGVPLKFVTVGEKLDALEEFHPDRMAGRILGMGDVVSLVEKAQAVVDEKDAQAMQKKLMENTFTLDDFLKQMNQLRKMGGMKSLLSLLPGIGQALKDIEIPEKEIKGIEAMIQSMTSDERENPEILSDSRRRRITRGSGKTMKELGDLLKQFGEMKKMVGKMGKAGMFGGGGMEALGNMLGGGAAGLPGMGGGRSMFGSKKQGTKAQRDIKKERKKNKKKRRK
jgi:signal recognition particle subunit SRP54